VRDRPQRAHLGDPGGELAHAVPVGDVKDERLRRASLSSERLGRLDDGRLVLVDQDDVLHQGGQHAGALQAHATARAGRDSHCRHYATLPVVK
jgi:hypothetical protein